MINSVFNCEGNALTVAKIGEQKEMILRAIESLFKSEMVFYYKRATEQFCPNGFFLKSKAITVARGESIKEDCLACTLVNPSRIKRGQ